MNKNPMPDKCWKLLTTKFPSNNPPLTRFVSEYVVNDNDLLYGLRHRTAESAHSKLTQLTRVWEFKLWDGVNVEMINGLTPYEFLSVGQHPNGVQMYVLCLPVVTSMASPARKRVRNSKPPKPPIEDEQKQLPLF